MITFYLLNSSTRRNAVILFSALWFIITTTFLEVLESAQNKAMQESEYDKLVYGGVWKHVIQSPQEDIPDVVQARKVAQDFILQRYPWISVTDKDIKCHTKLDLWYTFSNLEPVLLEKPTRQDQNYENFVSVPLSFGHLYNFHVLYSSNGSRFVHFLTVTKSPEFERFFIYSHIHHCEKDLSWNLLKQWAVQDNEKVHGSPVLSSLSRSKDFQILVSSASDNVLSSCKSDKDNDVHQECAKSGPVSRVSVDTATEKSCDHSKSSKLSLKVMTYNIWNYFTFSADHGDYLPRVSRLLKIVKEAQPDIVGFQEIRFEAPRGGRQGPSQMDHIVPHLPGYQFVYQPAMMHETCLEQGRTEEGVAIFSRFPIIFHDYILLHRNLSNNADGHQRVCLHAVILVPSVGPVHVFNTHWSLTHVARERAAAQILDYMKRYTGPAILMGDLNATPEEKAINGILKDSELQDAWELLHSGTDGSTFSCLENAPTKRIDYIFFRKESGLTLESITVVPDATRKKAASDHRPVLATFTCAQRNQSSS